MSTQSHPAYETKTVTFTEVGETSGVAYREVRDKLETLGLLVTKFLSDKPVSSFWSPSHGFQMIVWEIELEVQVIR